MRAIETEADAEGLSYDQMMLNAGRSIADAILEQIGDIQGKRVVILAGSGNNGGDGLVVGEHLAQEGAQVSVYLTKERAKDDSNLEKLRARNLIIAVWDQDQRARVLINLIDSSDIIVDAILGTGFELPLKGIAKKLLAKVKKSLEKREKRPYIVAVDCPSGVDCDTGQIAAEALPADLTVTLAAAKPGLLIGPGASSVGKLVVGDIGLENGKGELNKIMLEMADHDTVRELLPDRPLDAHKGTFGKVLIVAGSINYPGAALLAGVAAYRVGVGLVTMAVPAPIQALIAPNLPEATWVMLPHEMGVITEGAAPIVAEEFSSSDTILIGPGFGVDDVTRAFLSKVLGSVEHTQLSQIGFIRPENKGKINDVSLPPCVVDADGLKLLVEVASWNSLLPSDSILTPHPGEMAIMTGSSKEEIQSDRMGTAQKWAKEWGHVVVLKGAKTVVAAPDGRTTILPFETPALASAGTGDVLAGAIAGFRGQGVSAYEAAITGSYLHGRAGELSAQSLGNTASVMAGDVADALTAALSELMED
jgi:NAD(P)H-hydrate epimerase